MKSTPDSLYNLIHSLTRNEKGYVTRTFKKDGADSNVYYKVFEYLARLKEYDDQKIKAHFESNFPKVSLSRVKHYLYERLLEILGQYHLDNAVDFRLQEYLRHIKILFDKTLYKECYQRIRQAEKLARKYNYHLYLIEIKRWEFELLIQNQDIRLEITPGKTLAEQLNNALESFLEEVPYLEQHERLSNMMLHSRERFAESTSALAKDILQTPLLNRKDEPKTTIAQYLALRLKHISLQTIGKVEEAFEQAGRLKVLFNENPWFRERYSNYYLRFLSNYSNLLMLMKRPEQMEEVLDLIERHKPNSEHNRIWQKALYHYVRLRMHSTSVRDSSHEEMEDAALTFFRKNRASSIRSYAMVSLFNAGVSSFRRGEYKRAFRLFDEVRDDDKRFRTDLRYYARIMEVICLFMLQDDMLLEQRIRSLQYHWSKDADSITNLERNLVKFLRSRIHSPKLNRTLAEEFAQQWQKAGVSVRETWILGAIPFADFFRLLGIDIPETASEKAE